MSNYCRGRWGREGAAARGDSVRGNPREDEGKPGRHGRKGDRRVDKKKKTKRGETEAASGIDAMVIKTFS